MGNGNVGGVICEDSKVMLRIGVGWLIFGDWVRSKGVGIVGSKVVVGIGNTTTSGW